MRNNKSFSATLIVFISLLLITFLLCGGVDARKDHTNNKAKNHKHHQRRANQTQSSNIFDVLSFGAKGDGISDDSKALIAAWKAACKVESATVKIPKNLVFLIKPVSLQGPCMPYLVLQIDGILLAEIGKWQKSTSLYQWINIKWINNFTIQGAGTVDGQGFNWWSFSQFYYYIQKKSKKIPDMKPTAIRFYSSYNITIRDIKIINSPQCHLKFDNSGQVQINNITIFSPEDSPNTDGIHLQNTQDVEIQHSNIGCGDDCVSIQTGCSNVYVHDVNCGPGHGISLGGLGKDKSIACVSNVIVDNISMQNTLYGVRIKTWQGGMGSARNMSFSNIQVTNVKIPIMIDQYYCDKKSCKNQTGAVEILGVKYEKIIGTYSVQPIHLACSSEIPCSNIDLINIQLQPMRENNGRDALCWNSYGKTQGPSLPSSIDSCLSESYYKGITKRLSHPPLPNSNNICK